MMPAPSRSSERRTPRQRSEMTPSSWHQRGYRGSLIAFHRWPPGCLRQGSSVDGLPATAYTTEHHLYPSMCMTLDPTPTKSGLEFRAPYETMPTPWTSMPGRLLPDHLVASSTQQDVFLSSYSSTCHLPSALQDISNAFDMGGDQCPCSPLDVTTETQETCADIMVPIYRSSNAHCESSNAPCEAPNPNDGCLHQNSSSGVENTKLASTTPDQRFNRRRKSSKPSDYMPGFGKEMLLFNDASLAEEQQVHVDSPPVPELCVLENLAPTPERKNKRGQANRDKAFACPQCDRKFSRRSHLERHQSIHTEKKPFMCSDCHKTFSREDNLMQHRTPHCKRRRPRTCDTSALPMGADADTLLKPWKDGCAPVCFLHW